MLNAMFGLDTTQKKQNHASKYLQTKHDCASGKPATNGSHKQYACDDSFPKTAVCKKVCIGGITHAEKRKTKAHILGNDFIKTV